MGRPVVHFEIMGRDAPALRDFYGRLFDWEIDTGMAGAMDYGIIGPGDTADGEAQGIGGGIGAMPGERPGYVTFYVAVPDVEEALARAEGLGGTRIMGPMTVMERVEIGMFTDPEGNMIGVVKDLK
jgi:predicted enzyme related to lactoylglutathione lyase